MNELVWIQRDMLICREDIFIRWLRKLIVISVSVVLGGLFTILATLRAIRSTILMTVRLGVCVRNAITFSKERVFQMKGDNFYT